jgi:hypothetical protein
MKRKGNSNFRSGYEGRVSEKLEQIPKILVEYEVDKLPYVLEYIPDFKITLPNGYQFYVEAKGYFDRDAKTKMHRVKETNPNIDIRMLFQSKTGKQAISNAKWCLKYGFPYAFGEEIPTEWLKPEKKGLKSDAKLKSVSETIDELRDCVRSVVSPLPADSAKTAKRK